MGWLIWVVLLMFGGCSSPAFNLSNKEKIVIEIPKQDRILINAPMLLSEHMTLENILITRSLHAYRNDKKGIVVEHIRVQAPYAFQYDMKRTLDIVFEAKRVEQIDRIGNFGFYAIHLKDGSVLMCIAENINKKAAVMVYGFDKKTMNRLIEKSGGTSMHRIDRYSRIASLEPDASAFLSRWNAKMTIFDGLLKRMGYRALRR